MAASTPFEGTLYDEVVRVVSAAGFALIDPADEIARGLPLCSVKMAGGQMDADSRWPRHEVDVGLYAALETERSAHSVLAENTERLVQFLTDNLRRGNVTTWTEARYGTDAGNRPTPASPVYTIITIED